MTVFTGHIMGPPLCGTGNGRDGDKLLCNRCPLKHEARERRGVKCFTRTCPTEGPPSENLRIKIQLISQVHDVYIWYGRSHPNRVCYNPDLGYGRSHPTKIKKIDSGMVAAIQSVSHVHNDNNPQSQPRLQQTQSRVLHSISTQQVQVRACEYVS